MAINKDDFIASFKQQMQLLQDLGASVQEAIKTAQGQLTDMEQNGKSVEEVFGSPSPKK